MAALTEDEKRRLGIVLEVAGDNESRIRDGIIKAIPDIQGKGSRSYFWHLLETRARAKIRAARKNVDQCAQRPPFALT